MQEEVRRFHDFVGRAVREQEILGEQAWQASEFYWERARPNGIHRVLSMNLTTDGALGVPFLTFFRPLGALAFQDETTQACSRLIPHLRRAIRVADFADTRTCSIPHWTETLLDQFKSGIALLDRRGEILHANRRCLAILNKRDGLAVRFPQTGSFLRNVFHAILLWPEEAESDEGIEVFRHAEDFILKQRS